MKKTILFVLLDKYADWEAAYLSSLILALGQDKYTVKTVSITKESIQSLGGFTILPDYDLQSVPANFEGLILIGGLSWRGEAAQQIKPLAQDAFDRGKVLGGICDASAFLGTIGLLNQVSHTSNDLTDLKQWAGDAYTGEKKYLMQEAVRDRNIVTANGTATLEFTKEVLTALNIASEAKILEWYNFYKLGCYNAPLPTFNL